MRDRHLLNVNPQKYDWTVHLRHHEVRALREIEQLEEALRQYRKHRKLIQARARNRARRAALENRP